MKSKPPILIGGIIASVFLFLLAGCASVPPRIASEFGKTYYISPKDGDGVQDVLSVPISIEAAKKHGLAISASEILAILTFTLEGADAQQAKTLFVQEMLKRGFLASNIFYASLAHTDAHVRKYAKAVDEVFGIIAKARREGGVGKLLKGPVAHTGFQRLN